MPKELDLRVLDLSAIIRPGQNVIWGQGSGEALTLVETLVAQRKRIGRANVFVGGLSYSNILQPEHADVLSIAGNGAIGGLRELARAGVLNIIPCHLSQVPDYIRGGLIQADVAFVQVSPPNDRGEYSFALASDYQQAAIDRAPVVIAEVNDQLPWTYCDRPLTEDRITYLVRTSRPPIELPSRPIGDVERAIAGHVSQFIEDGAVIQMGIGAIPDAVLAGLFDRRDLGVHSGLISDRVADLMEKGVVTNARKVIDTGITTTAAFLGTRRLYDFARNNPAIRLYPLTHTHRASVISRLERVISINSAIEVDLTGQINAEVAGGSYVGSVGGQVDFVRGAQLSPGGRAIIALPSTARQGKVSRIVARTGAVTTTARSDADVIVTEFGAAELKGQPIAERIRRMLAISDPRFRESLECEARAMMRGST